MNTWIVFPQFWFPHGFSCYFSFKNSCHIWCTWMVWSSSVSSKQMLGRGSNNTLYPWVVFPQFWFSHVFSSNFSLRNSCHIWCTCMVSLQCGSSRVSSKQMIGWGSCNSLNTWIVFPQFWFPYRYSCYFSFRNSCHIWCTWMVSLPCGYSTSMSCFKANDWEELL